MKRYKRTALMFGLVGVTMAKVVLSIPALPGLQDQQGSAMAAENKTSSSDVASAEAPSVEPPKEIMDKTGTALASCDAPEELLLSIRNERRLLVSQRASLENRRSEIALAEAKLGIEKDALKELKTKVEALLDRVKAAQSQDLTRLVSLYSNMKPAEAARIMEDLDLEVTILVITSMKTRDAAPILAKMSPVRARAISKIILERSKLPGDQDLKNVRLN